MSDDDLVQEPKPKKIRVSKNIRNKLERFRWTAFDGNVLGVSTLQSKVTLRVAVSLPADFEKLLASICKFYDAFGSNPTVFFAFRDQGTNVMCYDLAINCIFDVVVRDTVRLTRDESIDESEYSLYQLPPKPFMSILKRFAAKMSLVTIYDREKLSISSESEGAELARAKKGGKARPSCDENDDEEEEEGDSDDERVNIDELIGTKGVDASTIPLTLASEDADMVVAACKSAKIHAKNHPHDFYVYVPAPLLDSLIKDKKGKSDQRADEDGVDNDTFVFSFSMPSADYIVDRAKLFFSVSCGSNITRFEVLSKTRADFESHRARLLIDEYVEGEGDSFYFADLTDENNNKIGPKDQLQQKINDASAREIGKIKRSLKGEYSYYLGKREFSTKHVMSIVKMAGNSSLLFAFRLNVHEWPKNRVQYVEALKKSEETDASENANVVRMEQAVQVAFDFDQEGGRGPYAVLTLASR